MKKPLLLIPLISITMVADACPACEKQQPKFLRGITHGGPSGNWDYVIVIAALIIVLVTLFYAIKWMVKPGETNTDHIKRTVLN